MDGPLGCQPSGDVMNKAATHVLADGFGARPPAPSLENLPGNVIGGSQSARVVSVARSKGLEYVCAGLHSHQHHS